MGFKARRAGYDEALAERVRAMLVPRGDASERKMFGGLCFLVRGHMACGLVGRDLMVRVGPEVYEAALALPGARPMDFTGRPLRGFVYVAGDRLGDDAALAQWVSRGVALADSLPAR